MLGIPMIASVIQSESLQADGSVWDGMSGKEGKKVVTTEKTFSTGPGGSALSLFPSRLFMGACLLGEKPGFLRLNICMLVEF